MPLVCKAFELSSDFYHWPLGNEPDLYKTSAQGIVRLSWWNESDYVPQRLNLPDSRWHKAAVVSFIGNSRESETCRLPLLMDEEAAYAAYWHGKLARVIVMNMQEFNDFLTTNESWTRPTGMRHNYNLDLGKPVRLSNQQCGHM